MKRRSVTFLDAGAVAAIVCATGALIAPSLGVQPTEEDRQKAQSVTCISNMKQLALGVMQYIQDYDETMPSGANWRASGSGWAAQIFPYVPHMAMYRCPSDPNPADVLSYGYNSNLVRLTKNAPSPPIGAKLAAMNGPASSIMLFETVNNAGSRPEAYSLTNSYGVELSDIHRTGRAWEPFDGWSPAGHGSGAALGDLSGLGAGAVDRPPLQYATGLMRGSQAGSRAFSVQGGRHFGKSTIAFCDGHVKLMDAQDISAGYNNDLVNNCGTQTRAANTGCASGWATFSIY